MYEKESTQRTGKSSDEHNAQDAPLTQAERRELSEKKIMMAAMVLVSEKGAQSVTLAEIGLKAGYSRGLPLHKYGNKSNLMKALAQYISANFPVFSDKSQAGERGLKRLESLINAYIIRSDDQWRSARALLMLTSEAALIGEDLSRYMADYNRQVLSYIRKNVEVAIAQDELKASCDANQVALFLLSVFRGTTLLHINDQKMTLSGIHTEAMRYLNTLRV